MQIGMTSDHRARQTLELMLTGKAFYQLKPCETQTHALSLKVELISEYWFPVTLYNTCKL